MSDVLHTILQATVPPTGVQAILTSLGITSSIISFVLTNILTRPAMVRWRQPVWRILALQWASVMVCFIDFVYPFPIAGVANLGSKLGIACWTLALINLLVLMRRIFLVSFTPNPTWFGRLFRRRDEPFEDVKVTTFGSPFLDEAAATARRSGGRIRHPILLVSERGAHGLRVALSFAEQGLRDVDGAVVWLGFTRPWPIVARQMAVPFEETKTTCQRPLVILDCYSQLYFPDEPHESGPPAQISRLDVRYCDPRDPVGVKDELKTRLRALRKAGARRVRVVYDSLSDFIAVADRELVVPYLRWSTVWDEIHNVQSMYLVWPDVLKEPVSTEYLEWFGNTVFTLKRDGAAYSALIEGVDETPMQLSYDDRLRTVPPQAPAPQPPLLRWLVNLLKP